MRINFQDEETKIMQSVPQGFVEGIRSEPALPSTLPRNNFLICPLIISSLNCTMLLDMVGRLLSNVCVVTSFYQRPASRVHFFLFFNLRNLLYLIISNGRHSPGTCRCLFEAGGYWALTTNLWYFVMFVKYPPCAQVILMIYCKQQAAGKARGFTCAQQGRPI